MYRQGDVLLVPVESCPPNARTISEGRHVLAEGEATGHAHVVEAPSSRLFQGSGDERFLELGTPSVLRHEEHSAIELPAGSYRVIRQREYVPHSRQTSDRVRYVSD